MIFIFSFLIFNISQAQNFSDSINHSIDGAINFLINTQQKETIGTDYYKGEWPSFLTQLKSSVYMGSQGDSAYDSNCYSSLMVHNTLCEIVLRHPEYSQLLPALGLSYNNIKSYKRGDGFVFWHELPPAQWWNKKRFSKNPQRYHATRPNHYQYKGNALNKYANIFNDADDTSLGYMAYLNSKKINHKFNISDTITSVSFPDTLFSHWRNTRKVRRSFSNYNLTYGYARHTGAFLTWFHREPVYNPLGFLFPSKKKPNLPMGVNNVDCVVNCNVVRALNAFGLQSTKGYQEACSLISHALTHEKRCFRCGIYYPSEFTLHYFASKALSEGVHELNDAVKQSVPFIISSQNADGSWRDRFQENEFHLTALGVNSLLNSGLKSDSVLAAIESGIKFLLVNKKQKDENYFWTGGIFFSAGEPLRFTHVWRSDAVTTALVLEAFIHYKESIKG